MLTVRDFFKIDNILVCEAPGFKSAKVIKVMIKDYVLFYITNYYPPGVINNLPEELNSDICKTMYPIKETTTLVEFALAHEEIKIYYYKDTRNLPLYITGGLYYSSQVDLVEIINSNLNKLYSEYEIFYKLNQMENL